MPCLFSLWKMGVYFIPLRIRTQSSILQFYQQLLLPCLLGCPRCADKPEGNVLMFDFLNFLNFSIFFTSGFHLIPQSHLWSKVYWCEHIASSAHPWRGEFRPCNQICFYCYKKMAVFLDLWATQAELGLWRSEQRFLVWNCEWLRNRLSYRNICFAHQIQNGVWKFPNCPGTYAGGFTGGGRSLCPLWRQF